MKKRVTRLDMFCGGGGASTGGDIAFDEKGIEIPFKQVVVHQSK